MQEKTTPHFSKKEAGSVLALLLVVTAVIGIVGMVVAGLVSSVMGSLGDEDIQIEAQMLASDLKEYTKYLISYEKIIFVDNPLRLEDDRKTKLLQLWKQGMYGYDMSASMNFWDTCGGFVGGDGTFIGNLFLGGHRVFCPIYLRRAEETSRTLQDMYLDFWSNPKRVTRTLVNNVPTPATMADVFDLEVNGQPLPPGWYRVTLNFDRLNRTTADPDWYLRNENSIPMYVGQRLFDLRRDSSIPIAIDAKVTIDIYTDSMGFSGQLSERYFKVTSTVTFRRDKLANKYERSYVDSESFVMRIPTIKDFSLFLPFPTESDGKTPTTSFAKAVQVNPGTNIRGRVFFNGDIDLPLDSLPQFYDTVFISGRLKTPVSVADLPKYRQKFRRGLISNLSGPRYIFDGPCLPPGDVNSGVGIVNGSGIACQSKDGKMKGLDNYPAYRGSACGCFPVKRTGSPLTWTFDKNSTCTPTGNYSTDCTPVANFLSTGVEDATASGMSYILAPIKKLNITKDHGTPMIWGTVVGGYIHSASAAEIFPLTEMTAGLVGSAEVLSQLSNEANGVAGGVSAPLINFPLIQYAKDGFK